MIDKAEKTKKLLKKTLELIDKYGVTAYKINLGTGISANGVQKIIDGETKNPQERTLTSIISYIEKLHESNKSTIFENDNEFFEKNGIKVYPNEMLDWLLDEPSRFFNHNNFNNFFKLSVREGVDQLLEEKGYKTAIEKK